MLAKKLEQAEEYIKSGEYDKGIALFDALCTNKVFRPKERLVSLEKFYSLYSFIKQYVKHEEYAPQNDALDTVSKLRDSLPFFKGDERDDCIELLSLISSSKVFPSHEKLICIVSLYNNFALDICYSSFALFAKDTVNILTHRIDATHYLFASNDEYYVKEAQSIILEIIFDESLTSEYRYDIIFQFTSKSGISTLTNFSKIRVPYDEAFVYILQHNFFRNSRNGAVERILSAQHLLNMKGDTPTQEERDSIFGVLLEIANERENSDNTRASAADLVCRMGDKSQIQKAKEIVVKLGYSALTRKVGVSKTKTLFNNAQNTHSFVEQAEKIIERIIAECGERGTSPSFDATRDDITNIMKLHEYSDEDKFNVSKALHRIALDEAMFTKYNVTLSEILCCLWVKVTELCIIHPEIDLRVVEELLDMNETCSSGHFTRLINVLSDFDSSYIIEYAEQITANAVARMNVRIRDCVDEDLRCKLAIAQTELADEEDKRKQENIERRVILRIRERRLRH